jgi:hypothetical protein
MKSTLVALGGNDEKARSHIIESLSVCANDDLLSRKIIGRFSMAVGPIYAIIGDWLQLDQMSAYDYMIPAPEGSPPFSAGDRPTERLVGFVKDYLRANKAAIVLCENWAAARKDVTELAKWPYQPPRIAFYGDQELYHAVTPEMTAPASIEDSIVPRHHWQTGVCSSCEQVPDGDIPNEGFLDKIVSNTKHIFIPAFDGSGYLIWSPVVGNGLGAA